MNYVAKRAAPQKKSFPWKAVVILVILLLVAAGIGAVSWYSSPKHLPAPDPNVRIGSLNMTAEAEIAALQDQVDRDTLRVFFNFTPSVSIKDAEQSCNWFFENREDSLNRVAVQVVRKDNGQVVYKSGYLEPGQYIENTALDQKFSTAGTYPCQARFYLYDLETGEYVSEIYGDIDLYVLE